MRTPPRPWPHPFRPIPWPDLAARYRALADEHPAFEHMADVVDSVRAHNLDAHLLACTSMHDLVVAAAPVPERPPIEVVVVRAPSSGEVGVGGVLIEHRSVTGRDDRIHRPAGEAVALFWRFMTEKFGLSTATGTAPADTPHT